MPRVSDVYDNYLGAKHLANGDGTYRETNAVVASVNEIELTKRNSEETERKLEMHFVDRDKSMILNKTNAGNLALAFGDDTDNWRGRSVVIGVQIWQTGPGLTIRPSKSQGSRGTPTGPADPPPPPAVDLPEDNNDIPW